MFFDLGGAAECGWSEVKKRVHKVQTLGLRFLFVAGFVAPQLQILKDMLLRRASPSDKNILESPSSGLLNTLSGVMRGW